MQAVSRPGGGNRIFALCGNEDGGTIAFMLREETLQRLREIARSVPVGTRFTEEQLMSEYGFSDLQELTEALEQAQRENLFLHAPLNYVIQEPQH